MDRQPRKRGRREDTETRQMILRVAQQYFMQYGYRTVTTRQLAEACGLTQPALYHHFSDKQELYLAVVSEEIAKIKTALERIIKRSEEVAERLKHVASFLLGRVQYDLSLMLHDVRYELSPEARAQLDEQFQKGFIAPLTTLFEQGINEEVMLSPGEGGLPPVAAAYLFMTMLSGFAREPASQSVLRSRSASHTATAELMVRLFLHGLSRTEKL